MGIKNWVWLWIFQLWIGAILMGQELYTLVEDRMRIPILTPEFAERQTLKIRLSNGLEAYLIEDPEASQAGAVLTVQAGSWNDPEEYPGLAHFLEHMLFLGTEKYPIESDYDRFIKAHDGSMNALTTSDYTLYLFSISPSAFEEALDRFASFFKKPLFNPSSIARELHAVNQEFEKNISQQSTRENHVHKELAHPEHPFHRFATGNSLTLTPVTQQVLREWYENHYSAHLMRLIVYAPLPLETLKTWVIKDFADIPIRGGSSSAHQTPLFNERMQNKIVYIEPFGNSRSLNLSWEIPLPWLHQETTRYADFIASLLGHEGPGSLMAHLKAEGLAEGISSDYYRLGKSHGVFSIYLDLTSEGLQKIPQVIEKCFQTIQMVQQEQIPLYLFEEYKNIHTYRYQYQSREETFQYLMKMGEDLVYEELNSFPENSLVPQIFNPTAIQEFLSYLTPQWTHLTVVAHIPGMTYDRQEQWMKIPYKVVALTSEQTEAWHHLPKNPHLHFPPPNPFIPQKLKLVHAPSSNQEDSPLFPQPVVLINNAQAKIYFAPDTRFQLPYIQWFFEIKTPAIEFDDPQKTALADLYIWCLNDALSSYSYPAELADLSYHISRTTNGILLSVTGYSENAGRLFETIATRLKNFPLSEETFQSFKMSLLTKYKNFIYQPPLHQGFETYHSILSEPYASHQQRAQALEGVSYDDFKHYLDHLYDQTYIKGLLYGNVSKDQALQVWRKLQSELGSQPFPHQQHLFSNTLTLPNRWGPYAVDLKIPFPAHAAILGIEFPTFSFKAHAAQQILSQAMTSAFHATLRTKQQTGYLISSHAEEINKHLFTFFAVQSTTHDPQDLLARFELFIESFLGEIDNDELTKEQFEEIRDSLLHTLEHTPQSLWETGHLLKTLALDYEDVEWMSKHIQGLKELTYEEFLDMTKQFLGKQNKRRLAILVRGSLHEKFHYFTLKNPQELRALSQKHQEDM